MQISGLPVSTAFGASDVLAIEINGVTYKITGATLAAALQSMGDYLTAQDIANNLTTTDEGYVLDARQGKALLDTLEAIGASDVGAVAVDQGTANAGKVLAVGNDGNVTTGKAVRPDVAQTLTAAEQAQARGNIGAASATELAAETAAREAADSDLKSAINAGLNPINLTGWESGGYNTTNGTNYTSPIYIRNQTFVSIAEGTERITCDSGYLMLLYAWKISDGSFVGSMKTSGVFDKTTVNYAMITEFDCVKYPEYKIKVTMRIDPASESITSADGAHCYFHNMTDKTLTKSNKAADAKITGEAKTAIDDLVKPVITWIDNYYINSSGILSSNSSYHWTGLIDIGNTGNRMYYRQLAFSSIGINIYNANSGVIATLVPSQSASPEYVTGVIDLSQYPNARYIAFGCAKTAEFDLRMTQGYKKTLSIPDNTITTAMIQDESVTLPKAAFAVHDPGTNFIDKTRVTSGKIINQSGAVANASGWCCTDYIELTPGTKYYISDYIYRKYWGFYNASKEVVGCYNDDGDLVYSFTFPSGAKYARFSFQTTEEYFNGAYVSINSGKPSDYGYKLNVETETPTDYEGMDVSTFNKLLCIGDSLTYGYFNRNSGATADYAAMAAKYSYPTQFKKITGVDTTNKGDSGKTTAEWYSLHGNEDLSGHDVCIIELGTNDGTWSATSETAMSNIIAKVKADNKGIKIFISTIPNGQSYVTSAYKAINAGIRAYVAGLSDADVYFIDLEAYGHMIQSAGYNAGHLSAYGYWRLAKDYANYISYIMNNNKNAFRLVQFTGTNDTYTP